jgi:hypothetical protein
LPGRFSTGNSTPYRRLPPGRAVAAIRHLITGRPPKANRAVGAERVRVYAGKEREHAFTFPSRAHAGSYLGGIHSSQLSVVGPMPRYQVDRPAMGPTNQTDRIRRDRDGVRASSSGPTSGSANWPDSIGSRILSPSSSRGTP